MGMEEIREDLLLHQSRIIEHTIDHPIEIIIIITKLFIQNTKTINTPKELYHAVVIK